MNFYSVTLTLCSVTVTLAIPTPQVMNPCVPSPCGPNAQCQEYAGNARCTCLPDYIGVPPRCRPECTISSECSANAACINNKCVDPCPGACGNNAQCSVVNHIPICSCLQSYTGDPFTNCYPQPQGNSLCYKKYIIPLEYLYV